MAPVVKDAQKPILIVRLSGGLGNQLFQYAFGRGLSAKLGSELRIDSRPLRSDAEPGRTFELNSFLIPDLEARPEDFSRAGIPDPLDGSLMGKARWRAFRALDSLRPRASRKFLNEQGFRFDPSIMTLSPSQSRYASGVWQSEGYFNNIASEVRAELALKSPSTHFEQWLKRIKGVGPSVSIHIRRGDYASNPKANALHGVCGPDYYERAVARLSDAHQGRLTCFVFSDDIAWARRNIHIDHPTEFVSDGTLTNAEEMALMAACDHNIIANSTFSWWAAWMNSNPRKTVIAPRRWFNAAHLDASDLIPLSWIKV